MPDEAFAHRLFQLSADYLTAGKRLHSDEPSVWRPTYFVLCHSIELALKAHLAAKGITANLSTTRKGHCLSCLYEYATAHGLVIDYDKLDILLDHIRDYTELMRYPDLELKQRIAPSEVVAACEAIYDAVQRANNMTFLKGMLSSGYEVVEVWHDRSLASKA